MTMGRNSPPKTELLQGTLDLLVLRALSTNPMHGFEITTWIEGRSRGALGIEDSDEAALLNYEFQKGLNP